VGERLLAGEPFRPSNNDYDWLGPGVYFWEASPRRGLAFARESMSRPGSSIAKPHVVGAIIELGQCLDLMTPEGLSLVLEAHRSLLGLYGAAGYRLPVNDDNLLRRRLDCAVIRRVHEIQQTAGRPAIDTVKGLFVEGPPLYPGAGFSSKTHVQIAVCNMCCIKGVFRIRPADLR